MMRGEGLGGQVGPQLNQCLDRLRSWRWDRKLMGNQIWSGAWRETGPGRRNKLGSMRQNRQQQQLELC